MQKKDRIIQFGFVAVLLIIITGYIGIRYYNYKRSEKPLVLNFTKDTMNIEQEGLTIDMAVAKYWTDNEFHPSSPIGAQYDLVVENHSGCTFNNWSAVMTYSGEVTIDSSWNGEFVAEGDCVSFTAQAEHTAVIPSQKIGTFGAVMYSQEVLTLEKCVITGYKSYSVHDLWIYQMLNLLTIIWAAALLSVIIMQINYKKYQKQQRNDARIIKQSMDMYIRFIDAKDSYTRGHSSRVAAYATEIARRMKLPQSEIDKLYYITLMHDCGKIGVPDAVLKKPGKLTDIEYEQIKMHTTLGDEILQNFTAIEGIREGAHFHHERYDGKGYPTGLKGEDIPLFARIICVADSYDAMSSDRCYRKQLDQDTIISEIRNNKGKQFDPEFAEIMIGMILDGTTEKIKSRDLNGTED